jgi:HlyD family secretion protein
MKHKKLLLVIIAAVIAIVAFAAFRSNAKDKAQYFTAAVTRGDVRAVVEATGTINAVTSVQVGSQVSGTISKLSADFNSQVKKGQVVARIDPTLFEGAVLQAKADLENARANYAAAQANVQKAQATDAQAKADFARTKALAAQGVLSQQQLDLAQANAGTATAQVSADQATMAQAKAQVSQKTAALQVSQTNLDHTIITAPIDGTIVNRAVDVGQTVAASLQAPTLFTIAQDLTKMQVYAKTDESDVGRIRAGQPVTFKVDAFPNETFRGVVQEVRMNATVVQNVVTYDTIVNFDNPDRKLFPGMTAYVSIPVASATDVLKIPNGALRFKPDLKPDEIKALYAKYNISIGNRGQQSTDAAQNNAGDSPPAAGDNSSGARPQGTRGGGGSGARQGGGAGMRGSGGAGGANAGSGGPNPPTVVWKLTADKQLQPVKITAGITDYTFTAVTSGDLKEGDELVTGSTSSKSSSGAPRIGANGPGGGAPRR